MYYSIFIPFTAKIRHSVRSAVYCVYETGEIIMTLKELIQQNSCAVSDGAMGTYFSALTGQNSGLCETYNVTSPDLIRKIHREYLAAGAVLLRTNTFSANSFTLGVSHEELCGILKAGYQLADECAQDHAVVCANVSAIYRPELTDEEVRREYEYIIDTFLSCGAATFLFETLPDLHPVLPAIDYLLSQKPDAEVIVSFTLLPDGHTRSGTSLQQLLFDISQSEEKLTMAGLNCGCGALQMMNVAAPFFSYIHEHTKLYTSVMPNAGYPAIENNRTVFTATPEYFAMQTSRLASLSVSVIGGCCGTEPEFIRALKDHLLQKDAPALPKTLHPSVHIRTHSFPSPAPSSSVFSEDRFILAAELDPPQNADLSKLLYAASALKESGVSVVTVSDSPLGHARMDSVICSSRIQRETGLEALPHICCRDKNLNALRSLLLGAHSEGIRSVLAVTGDAISETDRGIIKPVFNVDSTRLMELITKLNSDIFSHAPITIGGAFDPAPKKQHYSLTRLVKKQQNGASFVLTQPVFSEDCIPSLDLAREQGIKVLSGIMPLVSYRNACFMKNEVPGIHVPDELISRFHPDMTREEAAAEGVAIASELARKLKTHSDGFYFITPFNRSEVICRIIDLIKQN